MTTDHHAEQNAKPSSGTMADDRTRTEKSLDQHKLRKHPEQPDTDHDPRWDVRKAEKR